ncbi:MAG: hypothetical protein BRC26_03455 [Nanohaloarchaea archaeon QH_8_44_6]|nr:MAG: hypothetical protein BRC26_03455 [Nanohaloarchaea archaeon QH_8_44_6]
MNAKFLQSVLARESRAYGFTLAFWGSGALLIGEFGIPDLTGVLLYTSGAIIGFGLLSFWAFKSALYPVEFDEPRYLVFSMIHFLAALAPILVTYFVLPAGETAAFFVSGFCVSTFYNLFMIVEEKLSEHARVWEDKLLNTLKTTQ